MCWKRQFVVVTTWALGVFVGPAVAQDSSAGVRSVPQADRFWMPEVCYQTGPMDRVAFDEWSNGSVEAYADARARWKLLRAQVKLADGKLDESLARQMVDELWYDTGYPNANSNCQHTALTWIGCLIRTSSTTPEARVILRDGLIEYYHGGGAAQDESLARALTDAFDRGGFLDVPEVRKIVEELGDPTDVLPDQGQVMTTASLADKEAARKLLRDLRLFLRSGARDAHELERIAKRAAKGFGSDSIDETVLQALLTAYRQILSQRSRKAADEVVEVIDRDLLRIGRSAATGKQTKTVAKTRVLWARAVSAMGQRASETLRKFVHKQLDTETEKRMIQALRVADEKVSPSKKP